jgi:hypothetical protein
MPVATLDSSGTEIKLFYTDTGPLDSKDYTTIVIYHGSAFTARKQTGDTLSEPWADLQNCVVDQRHSEKYSLSSHPVTFD